MAKVTMGGVKYNHPGMNIIYEALSSAYDYFNNANVDNTDPYLEDFEFQLGLALDCMYGWCEHRLSILPLDTAKE